MPYRAIVAAGMPNLTVAGRCLAVADDLWDVTRCLPACCVSGEAAGVSSALQVQSAVAAPQLAVAALQKELVKGGVRLDSELVKPHRNYRPDPSADLRDEHI